MKKKTIQCNIDAEQITPQLFMECLSHDFERYKQLQNSSNINGQFISSDRQIENYSSFQKQQQKIKGRRISFGRSRLSNGKRMSKEKIAQIQKAIQKMEQVKSEKKLKESKNKIKNCKLFFENSNALSAIVKGQKIKNIRDNFIKKLKRVSFIYSQPVQFQDNQDKSIFKFFTYQGFQLNQIFDTVLTCICIIQISLLVFFYTLALIYQDLNDNKYVFATKIISIFIVLAQILINFMTVKFANGRKIGKYKQIWKFYIQNQFSVDFVGFLVLFIDTIFQFEGSSFIRLLIILKLPQCISKIQKLQVRFIKNIYDEQYWQLIKVFLFNFCYAHIVALLLAAMSKIDYENNWMVVKKINTAAWYEQYIWSYYWANTIMLTVGFGDLTASTYNEALCLIFIQTLSCLAMAYNINCIGNIISKIRQIDNKKSKKFKIFKKLTDYNQIPYQLAFRVNNYIQQSLNLKKKFNYQQDRQFLNQLPVSLRVDYLRQANKFIFQNLIFFRNLLQKTINSFAQNVQIKIAHPQEFIQTLDDDFNLIVLRKGRIGYLCKKNGWGFNDQIMNLISIKNGQTPFLTSLDFISKRKPQYQIKSLQFSVLYTLQYNKFIQIFRSNEMDYELYCLLRDKIKNLPDQFQVYQCEHCVKFNHFSFTCPKLHYVPLYQQVINKQLYRENIGKNKRLKFVRQKLQSLLPFQFCNIAKTNNTEELNFRRIITSRSLNQKNMKVLKSTNLSCKNIFENSNNFNNSGQKLIQQKNNYQKTKQIIEMQFVKNYKKQNFIDQVWLLNCDLMTNFNNYFPHDNPHLIREKYNQEQRLTKAMKRYAFVSVTQQKISKVLQEQKGQLDLII